MYRTIRSALGSKARQVANILAGPHPVPRVFGVGAAKTGTHTIGSMFADRVASAHEQDAERLIRLLMDHGSGSPALRRYLTSRDRSRRLLIDASQVNIYLIDDIEALFPNSLYVLTVRTPAAWLRSIIDDSLRREVEPVWHEFRDYRFGRKAAAATPDAPLAAADLYTLAGYLGYWRFSVERVLNGIAPERRLVVETSQLAARAADIARFSSVPEPERPPLTTHSFRNDTRSGVLDQIDPAHVEAQLEAIAGPLSRTLFPGWTAGEDFASVLNQPQSPA
jgi:hypothetical protein